jgi:hypothetical protein
MATDAWRGDASQEELMLRDECILVDESDAITGHASKRDAHRFTPAQPAGRLHRAFSVFLFDARGRLLLQQRAACKITFPGVWTNTCCSHPLYGQDPPGERWAEGSGASERRARRRAGFGATPGRSVCLFGACSRAGCVHHIWGLCPSSSLSLSFLPPPRRGGLARRRRLRRGARRQARRRAQA